MAFGMGAEVTRGPFVARKDETTIATTGEAIPTLRKSKNSPQLAPQTEIQGLNCPNSALVIHTSTSFPVELHHLCALRQGVEKPTLSKSVRFHLRKIASFSVREENAKTSLPPSPDSATSSKSNTISSGICLTCTTNSGIFPLRAFP